MEKLDSVAGPDRSDQIGESVHRSAMEGGDAIPSARRDIINKGFNPSFDHPREKSTNHASSGDAAEATSKKIGAEKAAKEAKEKAEKEARDAKM